MCKEPSGTCAHSWTCVCRKPPSRDMGVQGATRDTCAHTEASLQAHRPCTSAHLCTSTILGVLTHRDPCRHTCEHLCPATCLARVQALHQHRAHQHLCTSTMSLPECELCKSTLVCSHPLQARGPGTSTSAQGHRLSGHLAQVSTLQECTVLHGHRLCRSTHTTVHTHSPLHEWTPGVKLHLCTRAHPCTSAVCRGTHLAQA